LSARSDQAIEAIEAIKTKPRSARAGGDPGLVVLVASGIDQCMTARLLHPEALPRRRWYDLQVWKTRRRYQRRVEPLCRLCLAEGVVTPATIADHVVAHGGDWNSFRLGELQSLWEGAAIATPSARIV
jgi:hypothetical protein